MSSETKETKKPKRLRFILGQLLGFMLLIALLISNVLLIQRVRNSERELTQLRREQGKLVVDDPDQMNIIPVPGPQLDWRRNWSWRVNDREILDWFAANLYRVREPSLRWYVKALELKCSGLDWTQVIPLDPFSLRRRTVVELIEDPSFETQEARAREFVRRGSGCRATYFNHVRKIRQQMPHR
jgi:hypothetical protein